MQKDNLKTIIAFIIAFPLGLLLQFSNPAQALLIIVILIISSFFSLVVLVIGIFSKKFRVWYMIGLVPIIVAFSFSKVVRNYKHKKALAIKTQLELFRKANGKYPKDLTQIKNIIKIDGLKYSTYSSDTNYELEYLMDEFNKEHFDSNSGKWSTSGWND